MEGTTDSLRVLAPKWSLAGDQKLLDLLQNMHQKIVTNCQEVNTKLDEMASALDTSSINLQNVNNKFMALSNSQFIESRVYDDDNDVTMETKPAEAPHLSDVPDELALLRHGLQILDGAHETAEIIDESDSDDSDAAISVFLKPKDAYAHRPLPHIIGSQAWKNKWHAGLVLEDSDSDSSTSKPDAGAPEPYSESDEDIQTDKHMPDNTISETSSSFHSERDKDLSSVPDKKQTPADIAAEIAARLGQAPPKVLKEPEDVLPQPTPNTVYKPQKPISSTIFSDEPPPLDPSYEQYSSESQDEDDIFAEINKKQPYNTSNTAQNSLADDLFGRTVDNDFSDFKKEPKSVKQKSTLFEDESEPELFVEKSPQPKEMQKKTVENDDKTTKKPVGGISLFGSNKGTENIGAAILNRNRRKSSSSEKDISNSNKNTIENDAADDDSDEGDIHNANYIFDNLFAKAKQAEQKMAKPVKADTPVKQQKPKEVKDLISDSIFDDIDDIFTTNIKIPTKEANKNAKSIFDDDDNDLFSDIAKKSQETKDTKASSSHKKSVFDSDDELFSDVKVTKSNESQISKPTVTSKTSNENNNNDTTTSKQPIASINNSQNIDAKASIGKPKAKSKSIFDSDSDDDLFTDKIKIGNTKSTKSVLDEPASGLFEEKKETERDNILKTEKAKVFHSPSLFEEDEIDDLFINANKVRIENITSHNTIIEHVIPEDIPDINTVEVTNEIPVLSKVVEKTSNFDINDIPKEVEVKKPVIVDTKPYVFPKIDEPEPKPSKLFDDEDNLFTKHVETQSKVEENVMKDDIIETSQEPTEGKNKSTSIDVAIGSKLQEPVHNDIFTKNNEKEKVATKNQTLITEALGSSFTDNHKTTSRELNVPMFDEVPVKEKEDLIPEQKTPISIAASFDDIFSEPPAFEKTKEIKKTTNVNALFEDDSDDEALFFKKNDVVSDEKPDIFTTNVNFGLFNDEPPALVETDTKATINVFDDDNLFSSIPNTAVDNTNVINNPPDFDEWNDYPKDEPIGQSEKSETKAVKITNEAKIIPDSDDELFSNISLPDNSRNEKTSKELASKEVTDQLDDITKDKTETDKKIGKLNTKNFNINVQALVPGASPKKIPKERSEEPENCKVNEASLSEVDNAEPKEVISIGFESKPESGVLDNKVSKQRAKIQVKRRPSTRRARHEAVRKSVIDLEDDTDNSSSFDEPLPIISQNIHSKKESNKQNQKESKMAADKFDKVNKEVNENVAQTENLSEHSINTDNVYKDVIGESKNDINSKKFNIHDEITKDKIKSIDVVDFKKDLNVDKNELSKEVAESEPIKDPVKENEEKNSPPSTTKVVYILNDEDIFSNKTEKTNFNVKDEIVQNTNETDDNLFKNKDIKTIENTFKEVNTRIETTATNKNIATDSRTAKNIQTKDETIKREEDPPKTVQPAKKEAKSLFDLSDDDDDLFGKSKKNKKVEIKSKLFESDSEEDLFSGKKNESKDKNNKEVKKIKEVKKVTEVQKVVNKPLFGDYDDDDLFGVKTKSVSESKISTSSRPTTSKDAAKLTEAVFDDPLSMLDDD